MIKDDESLKEVWEWKDKVPADFLKSGYSNIIDFIKDETKDIKKKYNIKYHIESQVKDKQLSAAEY